LARRLSEYYCCSWAEAIEAALPQALRKGRPVSLAPALKPVSKKDKPQVTLVHDLDGRERWEVYFAKIKNSLDKGRSIVAIFADIGAVLKARELISAKFNRPVGVLYRMQPRELEEWSKVKEGKIPILVGTRSAIFAPLDNLGLVIIDEEQDFVYKQDQVPHYHVREIALMRTRIEKAELVFASSSPSLEAILLAKKNKIRYYFIPPKEALAEIKIFDMKYMPQALKFKKAVLSKFLEDAVSATLSLQGKVLLFLNRKGFATFLSCQHCGKILKCPRCNVHLVYHFKQNILLCHRCNFRMPPPAICPDCNSGYIKYSGIGTEKIESELSRIFPQAKIRNLEGLKNFRTDAADILIATEAIAKEEGLKFNLVGVLAIDNSLHRIDFRSGEKVFGLLIRLLRLTKDRLIIQTSLPQHHVFKALESNNIDMFYTEELKQRRQLGLPPYKHLGLVKIRGRKQGRVEEVSSVLFDRLREANKDKSLKIISLNPAQPSKLRGNYCWQILIAADTAGKISRFLKINLKKLPHSGIIVTVDIDPI
ncbi:primosomal protein N', partial [bacterium]